MVCGSATGRMALRLPRAVDALVVGQSQCGPREASDFLNALKIQIQTKGSILMW